MDVIESLICLSKDSGSTYRNRLATETGHVNACSLLLAMNGKTSWQVLLSATPAGTPNKQSIWLLEAYLHIMIECHMCLTKAHDCCGL